MGNLPDRDRHGDRPWMTGKRILKRALVLLLGLLVAPAAAGTLDVNDQAAINRALSADAGLLLQSMYAPPSGDHNPILLYSRAACCGETCTVTDDNGGNVLQYRVAAYLMAAQGRDLIVDGPCRSACTILVDELAPLGLACLTPRAELWIHRGVNVMRDGSLKASAGVAYRPALAALVRARGGQPTDGWLKLKPADLRGIVPTYH